MPNYIVTLSYSYFREAPTAEQAELDAVEEWNNESHPAEEMTIDIQED